MHNKLTNIIVMKQSRKNREKKVRSNEKLEKI